jgi:hypothetical protein
MCRTVVALNDNVFDVLATEGTWVRAAGQTCNLDLSRARIYRFEQSAGPASQEATWDRSGFAVRLAAAEPPPRGRGWTLDEGEAAS